MHIHPDWISRYCERELLVMPPKRDVLVAFLLVVPATAAAAGTIVNPSNVSFSGIVSEVRIQNDVVRGKLARTVIVATDGEFNTFSGGFVPIAPDGFQNPVGFKLSGDPVSEETVFLTGFPDVILNRALVSTSEMTVGVAAYATNFAPGDWELARLTFSTGGRFEIRGSDQEPNSLIFVSDTGDVVGRISGFVDAVPEPSSVSILQSGIFFCVVRRWLRRLGRTSRAYVP